MNTLLTVAIPVYNASGFLDNVLYSLKKLTFSDYKVLICAKASNSRQKRKIERTAGKYENTEVFFHQPATSGSTSTGKGGALDILIDKINTPYGVMMDADAVFLKKHWDKIILDRFNAQVKAGGAPKVFSKYPIDFPDSFLTVFDTKVFKDLNVSMMPRDKSEAGNIGWDVGWEMCDKFIKAGYGALVLEAKNTRDYKQGVFKDFIGVGEYYLKGCEHIFASHFGRGCSQLGSAKYRKGTNFFYRLPKIGRLFRMLKGKKDKEKWLRICRETVEKQV